MSAAAPTKAVAAAPSDSAPPASSAPAAVPPVAVPPAPPPAAPETPWVWYILIAIGLALLWFFLARKKEKS